MKPIFTIHAGEYLVGQEIEKKFPENRVWIPAKDTGIDLLVTSADCRSSISLQVKFSKDFLGMGVRQTVSAGIKSGGWWTFRRDKIEESPADYWVLVLYQFQTRSYDFVILPPRELLKRYDSLGRSKASIQSYVWVTSNAKPKCWESRGLNKVEQDSIASDEFKSDDRELTSFLNNWSSLFPLKFKT